jgi:hypothetical protein
VSLLLEAAASVMRYSSEYLPPFIKFVKTGNNLDATVVFLTSLGHF